jgi:hypothetical protein
MDEISEIIADIVSRIDTTINGEYDPGAGVTNYCSLKWARAGKIITDEIGNEYLIDAVNTDDLTIQATQLTGTPTPLTGLTFLNPPFYQGGTKLAANAEWTIVTNDLTAKTPLIWLLEIIRVTKFGRADVREFETSLRLFFLDETNVKDFYTQDHRREVVKPMTGLAEEFLNVVRNDRNFQTIEDYTLVTFSRFGVETDQGVIENILDANLSGVELQFTLTKYKNNCKNC